MWRLMLITAFTCCSLAASRAVEPLQEPLWSQRIADEIPPEERHIRPDRLQQEFSNGYGAYNSDTDYDLILPNPASKRGLALFARWGPMQTFSKDRSEHINTQTRSRLGPLRWG